MSDIRGLISSEQGRLAALQARHTALSELIEQEQKHPAANEFLLNQLKREKLQLKDKIEEESSCESNDRNVRRMTSH